MNKLMELQEKRKAIMANIDSVKTKEELDTIETELRKIDMLIKNEVEREDYVDPNIASMGPKDWTPDWTSRGIKHSSQLNVLGTYVTGNGSENDNLSQRGGNISNQQEINKLYEKRGQDLKEKRAVNFDMKELAELRAVTISSDSLIIPTQTSNTLNPTFNQVSSIIDLVKAVPLPGGEAYKKGFVIGYGEGDYTEENEDYTDADPIMDYVSIGKCKITAYCEMSEESVKLPNAAYQVEVAKSINIALRKKIAKQLLIGVGGENQIKGIFNAPSNVIPTASDIEITEIDADTLDTIVFKYGGDEDIEGNCYLILNKKDLAAFAAVRTSTGEKLYNITFNGNMGTISSSNSYSVNFILNSACPAISDSDTASETYCMAYGKLLGYEMPIFSPVEVQESRDFKFKSGQVCYRGSVFTGGSVAMYKGFTRIKKG
jgi:HK97 family phage major capsid protein